MNSKDIKKYTLISEIISRSSDDKKLQELFGELVSIDFTVAAELWEYTLNIHQSALGQIQTAENLETKIFALFNSASETKTRQLFIESLPLNKYIYSAAATSCTGTNLAFIVNLILSSKLTNAEEILRCVKSNATPNFDYAAAMRRIVDDVFREYCKRNDTKKCELSRKQSAMLLEYISKIKGPNKLLLTQRIKEL